MPVDNQSALDFGCGVGRLSHALADLFLNVTGIDVSPTMVAKANELNNNPDKAMQDFLYAQINAGIGYTFNTKK